MRCMVREFMSFIQRSIIFTLVYIMLILTSYWGCAVYEWKFNPGEWLQSTRYFWVTLSSLKTGILGLSYFAHLLQKL